MLKKSKKILASSLKRHGKEDRLKAASILPLVSKIEEIEKRKTGSHFMEGKQKPELTKHKKTESVPNLMLSKTREKFYQPSLGFL